MVRNRYLAVSTEVAQHHSSAHGCQVHTVSGTHCARYTFCQVHTVPGAHCARYTQNAECLNLDRVQVKTPVLWGAMRYFVDSTWNSVNRKQ